MTICFFGTLGSIVSDFFWPQADLFFWYALGYHFREFVAARMAICFFGTLGGIVSDFSVAAGGIIS